MLLTRLVQVLRKGDIPPFLIPTALVPRQRRLLLASGFDKPPLVFSSLYRALKPNLMVRFGVKSLNLSNLLSYTHVLDVCVIWGQGGLWWISFWIYPTTEVASI
jgi:hypothetical protein